MSDRRWEQGLLITADVLRSLEERGPSKLKPFVITFDSTPWYDQPLLLEQFDTILNNTTTKYSLPKISFTPLKLIDLPTEQQLLFKLADNQQRYIEVVAERSESIRTNIMFDSPITTLAWLYYMKAVSNYDKGNIKTSIGFTQSLINHFKHDLTQTNTLHEVRLIKPENLEGSPVKHLGVSGNLLLSERLEIFNGCLTTASKTFSEITQQEITFVH